MAHTNPNTSSQPVIRGQRHASRAAATYAQFLVDVATQTGWSEDEAERCTASVLATLEEQVTENDRACLEAELPTLLCERLRAEAIGSLNRGMDQCEFVERVAMRLRRDDLEEVEDIVRLVFRALRGHLSTGATYRVESRLPDDLRRLWCPSPFGRR